ncbi:MAG TPA: DUF4397 domain-containing protein [Rhodothermales bacterium]|nr:DUF4397 domain-containing protein [Rhodothermales bacterium]HRR07718.1 DUF4397 domain-containing protein [Rhodothermales bacterium]
MRTLSFLLAFASLSFIMGCDGDDPTQTEYANLRVYNGLSDVPLMAVKAGTTDVASNLNYQARAPFFQMKAGSRQTVGMYRQGSATPILEKQQTFVKDEMLFWLLLGNTTQPELLSITETPQTPVGGKALVRFVLGAKTTTLQYSVFLAPVGADFESVQQWSGNVGYKSVVAYRAFDPGNYQIAILNPNRNFTSKAITLAAGEVRTLILADPINPSDGFDLVNLKDN